MSETFFLVSITSQAKHKLPNNDPVLVGRSTTTDIILENPSVSNKHAIISVRGSNVYLRDMESTNGTFVNGEKLLKGEMKEIQVGDIIRFGFDSGSWRLEKFDSIVQPSQSKISNLYSFSDDPGRNRSIGSSGAGGIGSEGGIGGVGDIGGTGSIGEHGLNEYDISKPSGAHNNELHTSSFLANRRTSSKDKFSRSRVDLHSSPIYPSNDKKASDDMNEFEIWKATTEHLDQLEQRVVYLEDTASAHKDIDNQLKRQQVTLLANIRHLAHDLCMKLSNYTVSAKVKGASSVKEMLEQIESDLNLCSRKSSEMITMINELRSQNKALKNRVEEYEDANIQLIKESKKNISIEEQESELLRIQKRELENKVLDLESRLSQKDYELSELKEQLSRIDEKSGRRYHLLDVQNIELKKSNEDLRQELRSTHEYLSSVHSQLVESKSPRPKGRKSIHSALNGSPSSSHHESLTNADQEYIEFLKLKLEEKETENANLKIKLNRVSLAVEDQP